MSDKPCEFPCQKCGSGDVSRKFYAKGEHVQSAEYGVPPFPWTSGQCHSYTVWRDLILHHCRVCQYEWVTKPMAKKKKEVAS